MSKFSLSKKPETVISENDAIAQLMIFLEFYGIDLDERAKDFNKALKTESYTGDELGDAFTKLIMEGKIEIVSGPNGPSINQHTTDSGDGFTIITYGVLKGAARKATGKETDNNVERSWNLLSVLSGLTPAVFDKLGTIDSKVALEIAGLFRLA